MGYDTKELEEMALKFIEEEGLHFIDDTVCAMGIGRQTFYTHGLDKLDSIKDALWKNKQALKKDLRSKWSKTESAPLQIALYRLIGSDREYERLTSNQKLTIDNPSKQPLIVLNTKPEEEKSETDNQN